MRPRDPCPPPSRLLNKRMGARRDVAKPDLAPSVHCAPVHEHARAPRRTRPGPLFHFRISFHLSESTRDLSYRKASLSSAPGDRPVHSATILLSTSRSSQAALVPQEHKVFLEEAYNAGDRALGSGPSRDHHVLPLEQARGRGPGASTLQGQGCRGCRHGAASAESPEHPPRPPHTS